MLDLFFSRNSQKLLVLSIALGGLLSQNQAIFAQWKLEDSPTKTVTRTLKKASDKKASQSKSTPKEPASKELASNPSVDNSQPTAVPMPDKPVTLNKAVGMKAIEKDNQRFVHVPKATVRCGPGSDYYPTDVLSKGTAVEVYIETDDGWSGIRPPSGSHNWVQADALYLMPGGRVAEVSADNAPAWIGSDAVKAEKLLYQTQLQKTQTVAILGEAYRAQGDEQKLWFRIAPPQGEFRWIKSSMIGVTPVPKENPSPKEATELPKSEQPKQIASTKTSPVAQATYQEPDESKLAWSDEADQTRLVEQEIQREQQQAQQSILSKAPASNQKTRIAQAPPQKARPKAPQKVQPSAQPKSDPWQLIHQRQVGPQETDSMNHILGIFGMSLVDPNSIEGHPQQVRSKQPRPRQSNPAANYGSMPNAFGALTQPSAASAIAGIDSLPKPSGRYSQRRYSDLIYVPQDSFADRPSPLLPEYAPDVSTASFAQGDSARDSYYSTDTSPENLESFQTPQIQDAINQLSIIVSRPAEQWNLSPLRDSAKMWIERGETPLMRGEARLLLDRIERFESVRQRSSMTPLTPPTNYSEAVPLQRPSSESELSGWLVAVHTSLPGQPEFALTDDLGNVKAYVRPTTGLNLRRYVQQPVTVFGPQGFLPNLNAKQVVADRVVRLR
jgi:SH3-like domain-containing protein